MDPDALKSLLDAVAAGGVSPVDALARLTPAADELGVLTIDLDRQARCGFPEVVLAEGKTAAWTETALRRLAAAGQPAFATRVSADQADHLERAFPGADIDRLARTAFVAPPGWVPADRGRVFVVTAGTSDLPVAHEALNTARVMGAHAELIADVGVAGLHRLLRHRDRLATADVIIVVAGMDGALPSIVGGLVPCPVVAVPTSTGYGASFGGVAALLTMLNSCAAGVVVVNIDAGFKAGYAAARVVARVHGSGPGERGV